MSGHPSPSLLSSSPPPPLTRSSFSCRERFFLSSPALNMSQVETKEVSTALSDQMEEYGNMLDVQRRLDEMRIAEYGGEESMVEMTAMDDTTAVEGAVLSASLVSTCFDGSVTAEFDSSTDDLTDDLMSIYSDHEDSEIEVECPTLFFVSCEGKAMAVDSIEALNKLADFTPIPCDTTKFKFDSLVLPEGFSIKPQSVVEYTARAGDTDSCTTSPYHDYYKDAAITDPKEQADITSYSLAPSQIDVTVAAADEGLVENDTYSVYTALPSERVITMAAKSPVAADLTVYSVPKSERDVEMTDGDFEEDYSVYSERGASERGIEMLDTHSVYSEDASEIECNL